MENKNNELFAEYQFLTILGLSPEGLKNSVKELVSKGHLPTSIIVPNVSICGLNVVFAPIEKPTIGYLLNGTTGITVLEATEELLKILPKQAPTKIESKGEALLEKPVQEVQNQTQTHQNDNKTNQPDESSDNQPHSIAPNQ